MLKNPKELEAMFGVDDLKKTRFAQELLEEGKLERKLETIPHLLNKGFTVEEIAEILDLKAAQIREYINNLS